MGKLINYKHIAELSLQDNIAEVYGIVGFNTALWYEDAAKVLHNAAQEFRIDYRTICAVTAVLSPALRWDKNLLTMRQIVVDYLNDEISGSYMAYGKNVLKAVRLLSGENPLSVLGGSKVTAFYFNLQYPMVDTGYVTIDRHAINIALHGKSASNRKSGDFVATTKAHGLIASAYVQCAQFYGILPQQLQAATWSYCADSNSF